MGASNHPVSNYLELWEALANMPVTFLKKDDEFCTTAQCKAPPTLSDQSQPTSFQVTEPYSNPVIPCRGKKGSCSENEVTPVSTAFPRDSEISAFVSFGECSHLFHRASTCLQEAYLQNRQTGPRQILHKVTMHAIHCLLQGLLFQPYSKHIKQQPAITNSWKTHTQEALK